MSDYRALAAATVTLRNMLSDAIRVIPGARVRTGPPQELPSHEVADGLINLFLYRVQPNATWRNEELPFRRADGSLARKPQLAVDAHILVSFYGDDERQIPNRLFGLTLAALHTHAYPPLHFMPGAEASEDEALASGVDGLLAGAGLDRQHHPFYFTPQPMSHDELTKLWAIFAHIPYVPSVAYVGTVLLIESLEPVAPDLPVAQTAVSMSEALAPRIEQVEPALVAASPNARLVLRGHGLDAKGLRVRFDRELETTPLHSTATEIDVRLPASLAPGARVVEVVVPSPVDDTVSVSEPLSFILQPSILALGVEASEDHPPVLDVRFAPILRVAQRARVLLYAQDSNTASLTLGQRAWAFDTFTDPASGGALRIDAPADPGRYLVRLEIAGVVSPLIVETDAESPRYGGFIGPQVTLP